MCGIVGYFGLENKGQTVLEKMCNSISYRGPDDQGIYSDENVGLGQRRLSIIDVSPDGHQPMPNEDQTVWIIFNGEIYNFQDLKKKLKQKHLFRSKSDTEVILHLYEEVGENVFSLLNGMFSIAIYDKRSGKLLLARDRMGEKPLYYSQSQDGLIFASEPKALLLFPGLKREIEKESLSLFLCLQYTPIDKTLFKGIKKLLPGHFLELNLKKEKIRLKKFWDTGLTIDQKVETSTTVLGQLIEDAVSKRLISDVPLGVFLSGGLDSSTIAYYAQKNSEKKINTFSIGFREKSFDETEYANTVANFLGTKHHHKFFSEKDFLELIPKIFLLLDEPIADASILPTFLLSQFAREHVTVALGGDGADELLCGYPTFQAHKMADIYEYFPAITKKIISAAANGMPVSHKNFSLDFKLKRFINGAGQKGFLRDLYWTQAFGFEEQKKLFKTDFLYPNGDVHPLDTLSFYFTTKFTNIEKEILHFWQRGYLADDILVKLDRASMYNSLETRSPFLDHRLVEYINALPYNAKINFFETKYLLKKLMRDKLPSKIINRKKKGFGIPLSEWLSGSLKEFMLSSLDKKTINTIGFLNYDYIEDLIKSHIKKEKDNRMKIWTLLCFVEWHKHWIQSYE